jgi:tRNA A-37 threonylcarbamoyl transferase component Bud32
MSEAVENISHKTSDISEAARSVEVLERDFFSKLKNLPADLAAVWESRYNELEVVVNDFFDEFERFLQLRSGALANVLEIEPGLNEQIVAEIMEVNKVIRQTFGDPHYFLGNGRVAEVYELPLAPHLCVKYVKDDAAYSEGNSIRTEFNFLEQISGFSKSGIRAPLPYFVRIHPSEGHSYGMEKINGKSLSQILERPAENEALIEVIKDQDPAQIKASLLDYIKALHQEFKITHGDLFLRNIMVDDSGQYYVIDYGKSKLEDLGEDHEARRNTDLATINSEVGRFFKELDKVNLK